MAPASQLPPEIAGVLARGGTILTANQRAARTLRLDFDRRQNAEGRGTWQPPAIFAWDTFAVNLWRDFQIEGTTGQASNRLLLNRSQELQLWRSVIANDTGPQNSDAPWSSLKSVDSLATMAADAWQQLCAYRGQSRLKTLGVSGDTRAFQRWAQSFQQLCRSSLYLSNSELESALAPMVTNATLKPGLRDLFLIGFDMVTPAQAFLLDTLGNAGVSIAHQAPAASASNRTLTPSATLDDELDQTARAIREFLEANPQSRVAVIHPDIAAERTEIDRVFRDILSPELHDITVSVATAPYEFSLGQPLVQQPMVAVALKLLRWATVAIPISEISHLLLSPYFAAIPSEHAACAEFDAFDLRRATILRPEMDLPAFIGQVAKSRRSSDLSPLRKQLHDVHRAAIRLLAVADSAPRQKSFADWADTVRELLHSAAWASAAPDSSIEFQTRRKWESALDELATLDFEGRRATFPQALDQLAQIAGRTLFAPESNDAPVQIMGPREAAGSRFDALYFLRASDLSWPVRPGLVPLLGWRLQRDLDMPGSDSAHDAAHARRVTARLATSAPIVRFSFAEQTAESHQRPSPALAPLSLTLVEARPIPSPAPPIELEILEDSAFIPLLDSRVRGGADILRLQAACGFRAFAEKRLWSTVPDTLELGMDSKARGTVVHDALNTLWNGLRTQANLRALTSAERDRTLHHAIEHSLAHFSAQLGTTWDAAYLDVQRQRLHRLLNAWLDLELTRPPFEVKLREQDYEDVAIGPLRLSVRVDRVDTIPGQQGEIILDYKTGLTRPSGWKGERPDEPQLPLYAALREPGTVAAVTFANIRPGKDMGLLGIDSAGHALSKSAKTDFASLEDQIEDWHRVLTALAEEFAEGDARVRPKSYPLTCQYCRQRILCRLDPALLDDLEEEAEETDA